MAKNVEAAVAVAAAAAVWAWQILTAAAAAVAPIGRRLLRQRRREKPPSPIDYDGLFANCGQTVWLSPSLPTYLQKEKNWQRHLSVLSVSRKTSLHYFVSKGRWLSN